MAKPPKIDLRHFAGDGLNGRFRVAIQGLRKMDDFMDSEKAKSLFAAITAGKVWYDKQERLSPEKMVEVGRVGQYLVRDLRPHVADVRPFLELLKNDKYTTELKLKLGLPSLRVLGEACEVIALADINIEAWNAAVEQLLAWRLCPRLGAAPILVTSLVCYKKWTVHHRQRRDKLPCANVTGGRAAVARDAS
jgi:hypothetical protein